MADMDFGLFGGWFETLSICLQQSSIKISCQDPAEEIQPGS